MNARILQTRNARLGGAPFFPNSLPSSLVVWTTEFGRMPTFQKGASGRDHNPDGFTIWMTGAGVKRGFSLGATDDFGHRAVQDVTSIYDLHTTILHLLGLDHEALSFYHNGIERRLTDVHKHVLQSVLASPQHGRAHD